MGINTNMRRILLEKTIFDTEHEIRINEKLHSVSAQAKRLGLKYLGFGRYGKLRTIKFDDIKIKFLLLKLAIL